MEKHMATIRWAKQFIGTHVKGVEAGVQEIAAVINKAKERDGAVEDTDLKRALRGESRGLWSAVMGTYASTFGNVHHSPSRAGLLSQLATNAQIVRHADADGSTRYSLAELRTLTNRGQQHLIEYAKARRSE
jgi:hypothetical protein